MPASLALLVNPTAGRGRAGRWVDPVADRLAGAGARVEVAAAPDAARLADRCAELLAGGVDGVVALGGDGMVHLAVQAVAGTGLPLGIVPAGTGNDIAGGLGLPADPLAAADVVAAGRTRVVDAGRASAADGTSRWWAGVLGAGFDAAVNERANAMRWPAGPRRYDLAILAELARLRPHPVRLVLDGQARELDVTFVTVGNTASYGGGMRICPAADPTDGLLDVTVVGPVSRVELIKVKPRVYDGSHIHHRAVSTFRAREVSLAAGAGQLVAYADGERVGRLPLTCTVVPGALRIFAP